MNGDDDCDDDWWIYFMLGGCVWGLIGIFSVGMLALAIRLPGMTPAAIPWFDHMTGVFGMSVLGLLALSATVLIPTLVALIICVTIYRLRVLEGTQKRQERLDALDREVLLKAVNNPNLKSLKLPGHE